MRFGLAGRPTSTAPPPSGYGASDALVGVAFSGLMNSVVEPTTTIANQNVTTQAAFNSARANGALITVTSSFSEDLDWAGFDNMHVILAAGVSVGDIYIPNTSQYSKLEGADPRNNTIGLLMIGESGVGSAQDVTIEGVTQDVGNTNVTPSDPDHISNNVYAQRINIFSSYLEAWGFAFRSFASTTSPLDDCIIGNCQLIDLNGSHPDAPDGNGGQSTTRIMGGQRVILADNRIVGMEDEAGWGQWCFRIHAHSTRDASHIIGIRNQVEMHSNGHSIMVNSSGGGGTYELRHAYWLDNDEYWFNSAYGVLINFDGGLGTTASWAREWTCTGNSIESYGTGSGNMYNESQAAIVNASTGPGGESVGYFTWDISSNTPSWAGASTEPSPPPWTYQ